MCGFRGRRLVISSSYRTSIWFIIGPLFYNSMYPFWLTTSYNRPPFMVSVWSYHWWSMCPFASMPLWEWMYNNPWHILGYCCNYCFGKQSTYLEGGFPPFPSSHLATSGYSYYQGWLPYFDEHWINWQSTLLFCIVEMYWARFVTLLVISTISLLFSGISNANWQNIVVDSTLLHDPGWNIWVHNFRGLCRQEVRLVVKEFVSVAKSLSQP